MMEASQHGCHILYCSTNWNLKHSISFIYPPKAGYLLAFPSGEGGPLAVDEEVDYSRVQILRKAFCNKGYLLVCDLLIRHGLLRYAQPCHLPRWGRLRSSLPRGREDTKRIPNSNLSVHKFLFFELFLHATSLPRHQEFPRVLENSTCRLFSISRTAISYSAR